MVKFAGQGLDIMIAIQLYTLANQSFTHLSSDIPGVDSSLPAAAFLAEVWEPLTIVLSTPAVIQRVPGNFS